MDTAQAHVGGQIDPGEPLAQDRGALGLGLELARPLRGHFRPARERQDQRRGGVGGRIGERARGPERIEEGEARRGIGPERARQLDLGASELVEGDEQCALRSRHQDARARRVDLSGHAGLDLGVGEPDQRLGDLEVRAPRGRHRSGARRAQVGDGRPLRRGLGARALIGAARLEPPVRRPQAFPAPGIEHRLARLEARIDALDRPDQVGRGGGSGRRGEREPEGSGVERAVEPGGTPGERRQERRAGLADLRLRFLGPEPREPHRRRGRGGDRHRLGERERAGGRRRTRERGRRRERERCGQCR